MSYTVLQRNDRVSFEEPIVKNSKDRNREIGSKEYWRPIHDPNDKTYNVVGAINGRDRVGTKNQDKKAQEEVSELHGCEWCVSIFQQFQYGVAWNI